MIDGRNGNHPDDFKVRHKGKKNGETVIGWFPLNKAATARLVGSLITLDHSFLNNNLECIFSFRNPPPSR